MTEESQVVTPLLTRYLQDSDSEIARLARLCRIPLLEPGIVSRVLRNDQSVCGALDALAFARLRTLLILHFAIREKAAEASATLQMPAIENEIIERLRKSFPELAIWAPAA